ncbi:MAG TPA: amidohydrolase family protein [Acidimicrobiales bacterium]|nr:amidohydrolase family protein [Acidimicrobiales bacterium]
MTTTIPSPTTTTPESFRGRLVDCDAHLHPVPADFPLMLGASFAQRYRELESQRIGLDVIDQMVEQSKSIVLGPDNVWEVKGWASPAAGDARERLKALDLMGIDRQILFPIAFVAALLVSKMEGAAEAARIHNDYILEWSKEAKGRLRPVAMIPTLTVDAALEETRRTLDAGAYAVNIACGRPPGDLSPADPAWDPFWAMLAEADVPALLHIGGEAGFVPRPWGRIPSIDERPSQRGGEALGPYNLVTMHMGAQAFVSAMVLGGVFERHPSLRFGVIELGAQWVGPMADLMDQRVKVKLAGNAPLAESLPLKPSEYLARNVRVTPFFFEPVGTYIDRYGLEDVYVFSTDYPHPEGGRRPIQDSYESLKHLGDAVIEKYMVRNGELLLPPR